MNKSPASFDSDARTIICNVIKFFDDQKKSGKWIFPLEKATELAAAATGKPISFIKKLRTKLKSDGKECSRCSKDETTKLFACERCPALLTDTSQLEEHLKSHEAGPQHKCTICLKTYNRYSNLIKHKIKHTQTEEIEHDVNLIAVNNSTNFGMKKVVASPVTVSEKNIELDKDVDWKINLNDSTDNLKSIASVSSQTSGGNENVAEASNMEMRIEDECDTDDVTKTEIEEVNVHNKFLKGNFPCTKVECGKICKSLSSLKVHEMRHAGKKSYLCVICGKDFVTKNSLTCHEKIHSDKKGYICKLCNMEFSVRSNLRTHEKKYHEGFRFYCSQCTRFFLNKCSLERHEKTHIGIKDFKCDSCQAAFYTNKELLKHRKYHEGLRLYKCEQCFKTFFERHHLLIHQRTHSGERPYVCQIPDCGKSFTESQKLKKHQNTKHTHQARIK